MNTQLAQLMRAMINYDSGDALRIQHFVKVHNFAATIGIAEHLDEETQFILEAAAILHDIGIHPAEAITARHKKNWDPAKRVNY